MNNRGVKVVKVNHQDMGNWAYRQGKTSYLHYHISGRVLGVPHQPYPESVYLPDRSSGFYERFIPLYLADIEEIKRKIAIVSTQARYDPEHWS